MGSFAATGVDYAIALVIVLVTVAGGTTLARALKVNPLTGALVVLASFVFAFAKYLNTLVDGSDAMGYYFSSFGRIEIAFGTDMVTAATAVFSQDLGLAFLPTNMVFASAGAIASLLFYSAWIRSCLIKPSALDHGFFFSIIVVAVGFWGGGIGKDAIALLGTSLFCFSLSGQRPNVSSLIFGVFLMVIVRPHIGAAMLVGLATAVPFARDLPVKFRAPLLGLSILSLLFLVPFVAWYIGLGTDADLSDLQSNIEERSTNFAGSAGFVDISSLPLVLKLLSYLFRPLPYEARSLTQLVASGQNSILLILIMLLVFKSKRSGHSRDFTSVALICFAFAAFIPLSIGTSNLGISMRQKWMFVPPLLMALVQLKSWKNLSDMRLLSIRRDLQRRS